MKEFLKNIKYAWKFTKDQKSKLIKYIVCNIIAIFISIVVPILSAKIIIALTDSAFLQLIFIALMIFLIENLRNIIYYFSRGYSQTIYRESFVTIQTALGKEMLKLENKVIDSNSSGVFIQRLTNDTSKLADIFNLLSMNLSNIITDIGIFIAVFIINKYAFIFLVIMTLVTYFVEEKRATIYNEEDKSFRKEVEKVSGFVGEMVRGLRDIKMLNAEDSFLNELHTKVVNLNQKRYDMQDVNRAYYLLIGFIRDLSDFLLILLLVGLITIDQLEVATALIVYNYSGRVSYIVNYIVSYLSGNCIIKSCKHAVLQACFISRSVRFSFTNFKLSLILKLNIYGLWFIIVIFPLMLSLVKSLISIPSTVIVPFSVSYILHKRLKIVVLPAPLFPTNATVSLAFILKLKLLSILSLS